MVSSSAGGAYIQELEALVIMKVQNYLKTQLWIELNTNIAKWMDKG